MKNINKTMGTREWSLIIILSIIWGGSFFFVEVAVRQMTPLTIVLCRVGFASTIMLGFVYLTGRKMPASINMWIAFLILGVLNNVIPFSLITWGQKYIDSSLAAILNAAAPIFSVILAHFLTKEERLTPKRIAGVLLGWIGVAVLIGVEALEGIGLAFIGQLAVLGAGLFYACAAIFGRRFKDIDPIVVTTGMLSGSTIMMIPLVLMIEQPWNLSPDITTWIAISGLSIICTSLAYIIYFRVLASAGPTNILLVTFLIPVSAIFLGVVFLGEQPGWNVFSGMALIFLGLIAIDGRLIDRFTHKNN
ncbi:MAG: DMT family transporter [Desulfobacteraceae bacterium]|nr:DMT family transporter [Desulfobacteraceae bacterium]